MRITIDTKQAIADIKGIDDLSEAARNKINSLHETLKKEENNVKKVETKMEKITRWVSEHKTQLNQYWMYLQQSTTLLLSQLSNIAQTSEDQARIQKILMIQNIISTQISIGRSVLEAQAAFAKGNVAQGIFLSLISAGLEIQLFQAQVARVESERTEAIASNLADQISRWSDLNA